jgi:hypothetical protein
MENNYLDLLPDELINILILLLRYEFGNLFELSIRCKNLYESFIDRFMCGSFDNVILSMIWEKSASGLYTLDHYLPYSDLKLFEINNKIKYKINDKDICIDDILCMKNKLEIIIVSNYFQYSCSLDGTNYVFYDKHDKLFICYLVTYRTSEGYRECNLYYSHDFKYIWDILHEEFKIFLLSLLDFYRTNLHLYLLTLLNK